MNKIKRIIIVISVVLIISMMIVAGVYISYHPTHYKYCDNWIIGKSIDEVEERYGEFDVKTKTLVGYYIYYEDFKIPSECINYYYYMKVSKDGLVYEVYTGPERGG